MISIKSPFKFLDSYTKDDREIFFGRDREIEELYHRVFESKIMLVYGVSGTGKSSLIHCGLANKFQDTDWLPIVIRRGGNIIESMAEGTKSASLTEQQSKLITPADFKKGVRSLYLDHYKPVFFIFDQFEELFIFGDKEERRSFIQIVKSLVESELQCRFIFVMREEYMAWVTEFEKVISTFFSNRIRIEKMSHINALEAIKGPCNAFNISLEEGFAENLLEKLSPGETDVELTYLQVFLDKVFRLTAENLSPLRGEPKGGSSSETDQKENLSFTLPLLQKIGDVSDLLGSFLDEQISLLDEPETGLAVLKSFVSVKGTKQTMTPAEVKEYALTLGRDVSEPVIKDLIQNFVNLRILCDKDQNGRYELRHDALASKIFEKFTMVEKELLEVRKFVENAFYSYEKRGILLNKQDLEYLSGYENKLILRQCLSDFITQSKEKLLKQSHVLKRITRITTLVFIIILAITIRFYFSTQQGNDINAAFESAIVLSTTDPVKGLKAELDLWKQDSSSSQLYGLIIKDFQRIISMNVDSADPIFKLQTSFKPVILDSPVLNAEISDEGRYIYGWTQNQGVFVYDLTSAKTSTFKTEIELIDMKISERDSILALIFENGKISVCKFNGEKLFTFKTSVNNLKNNQLACFFKSGNYLIAVAKENNVVIYDNAGHEAFNLKGHNGNVNSLDISPDGKFIVTVSDDKNGFIWNYNQKENNYTIYDTLVGHKDKIWSCRFNKTGKYILTASADSTIKIWNLNGRQINPALSFLVKAVGNRYRFNNGEKDEDRGNQDFSIYYGKFCDASFSRGEMEIIATGYAENDSAKNNKPSFYKALFYDGGGGFPKAFGRTYFVRPLGEATYKPMLFSDLIISPDEKVAAAVNISSSQVLLLAGNFVLATFTGSNPMFSKNGKNLYWVSEEKIYKIPIQEEEIRRIIDSALSMQRPADTKFIEI